MSTPKTQITIPEQANQLLERIQQLERKIWGAKKSSKAQLVADLLTTKAALAELSDLIDGLELAARAIAKTTKP